MRLQQFVFENGLIDPGAVAHVFLTTRDEIAHSAGLPRDAVVRKKRIDTPRTQQRLRQMIEIVNRVEARFGSALMAFAWFRSTPLPGLGHRTAMSMVRDGKAQEVLDLLDAIDAGVHA